MTRALKPRTLACLLVALGACQCDEGPATNQAGGRIQFERELVDFGHVIIGQQKKLSFKVTNTGRGPIKITSIDRKPDFPEEFAYSPQRGISLESGNDVNITFAFEPTAEGAREGVLVFQNDSGEPEVELTVKGNGVRTDLRFEPPEVDFGTVILEEEATRPFVLRNAGASDVDVLIDNLSGDNPEMFHVEFPGTDQRSLHLASGEKVDASATFGPLGVGTFDAQLKVRACQDCDPVVLRLGGKGLAAGLIADPDPLEFGVVLPRQKLVKPLTFRNIGNRTISITNIRAESVASEFSVLPTGGWPTLAPNGVAQINVQYQPTGIGPDSSRLVVDTDDTRAPRFDVAVKGYGGGPQIQLTPQTLDFGLVAKGFPITRRIAITNKGVNDNGSTNDDLVVSEIGLPTGLEYSWSLPAGVTLPLRVPPGQRQFLEIRYDPRDEGEDTAQVTLTTNDQLLPIAAVNLHGTGRDLPPCDLEIVPAPTPGLDFGVVAAGRRSELNFTLHNVGVNSCILGKVDIAETGATTTSPYSLVGGPIYGQELPADTAGQGRLTLTVRFEPPGTTVAQNYPGAIDIWVNASTPADAQRKLLLKGRGADVCLSITPMGVDFGVVRPACETNERMFTIYNACGSRVQIKDIRIGSGGNYFHLGTISPALPRNLDDQQQLRFSARYRSPALPPGDADPPIPPDLGPHQGTIEILTNETARTAGEPYILTLDGRGDLNANMVESFGQADRAKADILFVVDDSGSMEEEQTTLGSEFESFMRFANNLGIDYQIAVVSTSVGGGYPSGRILPENSPTRIVTPAMSDPVGTFASNARLGTDGNYDETGQEAAYLALSGPLLFGPNAGFVRPDAYLSIIIVSDEEDSSARTNDFYANFFQNVKGPRGANLVSVSGIVGTDNPTCSGPGGSADFGERYIDAAQRLNGITESICSANWSQALQKLSLIAFGNKSRFTLGSEPDLGSLHVFIDQDPNDTDPPVEYPPGPIWTYVPETNTVDFSPLAVPPAGSRIDVQYTVACH